MTAAEHLTWRRDRDGILRAVSPAPRPKPEQPPAFLTVNEVAARWRVSRMSIYRLIHDGELPHVRIGSAFRIPTEAVENYIKRQETW